MFKRYGFLTCLILAVAASALAAGPPDAGMSMVQDCLVTCPLGDVSFLVVVMDAAGDPCPGVDVEIDFCGVPGAQLCSHATGGNCTDGTNDVISMTTNAAGEALFYIPAGGSSAADQAEIRAAGVVLATRVARGFDVNHDFIVTVDDGATFPSLAFDFNCDGIANLSDTALYGYHPDHSCDPPVSTDHQTWGGLKSIWR